jgi:hypothetical protein
LRRSEAEKPPSGAVLLCAARRSAKAVFAYRAGLSALRGGLIKPLRGGSIKPLRGLWIG